MADVIGELLSGAQDQIVIVVAWLPFLMAASIGTLGVLTMNVAYLMFTLGLLLSLLAGLAFGRVASSLAGGYMSTVPAWVPLVFAAAAGVIGIVTMGIPTGVLLGLLTLVILGPLGTLLKRVELTSPPDRCGFLPPVLPGDVTSWSRLYPSTWTLALTFMLVYIFRTASSVLETDGLPPWLDDEQQRDARRTAVTVLLFMAVVALWMLAHRWVMTGCESLLPTFFGALLGGSIGYGWFAVANGCPRWIADLLGMTSRYAPTAPVASGTNVFKCNAT